MKKKVISKSSKPAAEKLISANKDFNHSYKHHQYSYDSLKDSKPIFKAKYGMAGILISALTIWLFMGEHNSPLVSQSLPLKEITKLTGLETSVEDNSINESAEEDEEPSTSTKRQESSTTINDNVTIPSEHLKTTQKNLETVTLKVRRNDNLTSIFKRLNINKNELTPIITNKKINHKLKSIYFGQQLTIQFDKNTRKLESITFFLDKFRLYSISKDSRNKDKLIGEIQKLDLTEKNSFAKLTINSSLFEDAKKQGLANNLIFQIIDIFTWDIDFAQDLRTGDSVELLYKEYYYHGTPYATGPIQAIRFSNNNSTYKAVRYEANGNTDYYTPEGLSLRKAFIRTPVKFTRISSRFSLGRKHPLLHRIRAHRGVDYAAPTGTAIKAAGDGTIIHYGRKGGYGKAAIIKHGSKYTTLYAHMSRYKPGLRRGKSVKQGQVIGYVGKTGLATGPHLHFEFRVNGAHKNPLTVPLPKARAISNKQRVKYIDYAKSQMATLEQYANHARAFDNTTISYKGNFE